MTKMDINEVVQKYLKEEKLEGYDYRKDEWNNNVRPILTKYCKPFLKEKVMLYRGTHEHDESILFLKVRDDRKSSDSPEWIQTEFDKASKKLFGFKARSECLFTVPNKRSAAGYGSICTVFPKGNFQYLWSPEIRDLFYKYKADIKNDPTAKNPDDYYGDFWGDFVQKYYQTFGLKDSIKSKSEVMLYCPNGYYAVDMDYEYTIKEEFGLK